MLRIIVSSVLSLNYYISHFYNKIYIFVFISSCIFFPLHLSPFSFIVLLEIWSLVLCFFQHELKLHWLNILNNRVMRYARNNVLIFFLHQVLTITLRQIYSSASGICIWTVLHFPLLFQLITSRHLF